jgi:hypothetical protein
VHSALLVGLLRAKMMGCSLNDAMSRRISGVNAPPAADAPEDIYEHSSLFPSYNKKINKILISIDCLPFMAKKFITITSLKHINFYQKNQIFRFSTTIPLSFIVTNIM